MRASGQLRSAGAPWFASITVLVCALLALGAVHASAVLGAAVRPGAYDVIVVGSEPEAIVAAVAAAESGARTLLISEDERLGGLFVLGAMNVLDLRMRPTPYQRGLFERWWHLVGRGHAFDVARAERAFADLLDAAGVRVRLGAPPLAPLLQGGSVVGVVPWRETPIRAAQVIDGGADADVADLAGARSTIGFASLGWPARMADTLVFRIDGVDWAALERGARARGRHYAYVDDRVAYGHFGGYPAAYVPQTPGLRLRGLNLGRQDDGSVLVNALLIYGVDPFDPASRAEGYARAAAEVPAVVSYLAQALPGFERARPGGVAETLYVRQTRHLVAHCILSVDDVLDAVVTNLDVAAGGYPLDVQSVHPSDNGFVFGAPSIYGARLCMAVPKGVDGLWVVGRSAGFDPIAQSSARVVPFGMSVAEAVGVAAALAAALGITPAELARDPVLVRDVRESLGSRGAFLPPVQARRPAGPYGHPHYHDYRALLRWAMAVGGYDNDPQLDARSSRTALLYLLSNVFRRVYHDPRTGTELIGRFGLDDGPLDAATAARITAEALCRLDRCPDGETWADLQASGLLLAEPDQALRRGQVYALANLLVAGKRPGYDRAHTPPW